MLRLQGVKLFIKQRLTVAVDEIMWHLEKTFMEFEEELETRCHLLLSTDPDPEPSGEQSSAAVQQLVMKKEVPAEQEWKPRQTQDSPDGLHIVEFQTIKEFMNQHSSSFPFSCGHVKSDAEIQAPQLHHRSAEEKLLAPCSPEQMRPEAEVEKCEEPHSMFGSGGSLPHSADDWMDAGEPQTAVNTMKVPEKDTGCKTPNKTFTCSDCGEVYWQKHNLRIHMRGHTGEKPFSCSHSGKKITAKQRPRQRMPIHTREKRAICPICGERFAQKGNLTGHMKRHAREKPR